MPPADLNGLVRFAERRNMVSARVPSHFKRSLPTFPSEFFARLRIVYSFKAFCDGSALLKIGFTRQELVK
jgi:hypothetical protein